MDKENPRISRLYAKLKSCETSNPEAFLRDNSTCNAKKLFCLTRMATTHPVLRETIYSSEEWDKFEVDFRYFETVRLSEQFSYTDGNETKTIIPQRHDTAILLARKIENAFEKAIHWKPVSEELKDVKRQLSEISNKIAQFSQHEKTKKSENTFQQFIDLEFKHKQLSEEIGFRETEIAAKANYPKNKSTHTKITLFTAEVIHVTSVLFPSKDRTRGQVGSGDGIPAFAARLVNCILAFSDHRYLLSASTDNDAGIEFHDYIYDDKTASNTYRRRKKRKKNSIKTYC